MNAGKAWRKIAALSLGAALVLSGCGSDTAGKLWDALEEKRAPTPTASQSVSSEAPEKKSTDYSKYNAYLQLSDCMAEMEEILSVYFSNVGYTAEFTLLGDYSAIKEPIQSYISNTYYAERALDYADEEPFYPEVDAAVQALGESPAQVMEALDDLASYLRFDDFEDDNMARAPQLHAQLWAALQTYDANYRTFTAALGELADATREEGLEELLADEQMILYHSSMMIYTSQDILDGIWDQVETAAGKADPNEEFELPAIDPTDLSPLFGQLQTSYEALTKALESEEERGKLSSFTGKVGDSAVKLYTSKVNSCYVKMGALAQALLDGADYADAYDEASEAVSGLIGSYNSIN